jgi:hypothetical protein
MKAPISSVIILCLLICLIGCQDNSLDVPFTYESDNFESPTSVKFIYPNNDVDSLAWSFSKNLSNDKSQLPSQDKSTRKEVTVGFSEPGFYGVKLITFRNNKRQEYYKRIQILLPTILSVSLINKYERPGINGLVSIYNSEKDAQSRQNVIASKSIGKYSSVSFSKLKAQKYFLRANMQDCNGRTLENDIIYSTREEIVANTWNRISLKIETEEVNIKLINVKDSMMKVFICKKDGCSSPSSDTPFDFTIESNSSKIIKLPLGYNDINCLYEDKVGDKIILKGASKGFQIECDSKIEWIIGS